MNDVILLIATTETVDSYGDLTITETSRQVFCRQASVGGKEFYQAAAVGLKPEVKFILADYYDYAGELIVEHERIRYRVLRTYRTGNELELTCYTEVNPPVITPPAGGAQ